MRVFRRECDTEQAAREALRVAADAPATRQSAGRCCASQRGALQGKPEHQTSVCGQAATHAQCGCKNAALAKRLWARKREEPAQTASGSSHPRPQERATRTQRRSSWAAERRRDARAGRPREQRGAPPAPLAKQNKVRLVVESTSDSALATCGPARYPSQVQVRRVCESVVCVVFRGVEPPADVW